MENLEIRESKSPRGILVFIAILLTLQLALSIYSTYQDAKADKSARFDRHNPELFR